MRFLISILMLAAATTVHAHHAAGAVYNVNRVSEIEGSVIDVAWRNPHVKISLRVSGKVEPTIWILESGAINTIQRLGVNIGDIVVGDIIRAAGAPASNGEARIFVSNILLDDGKELLMLPASPPRWTEKETRNSVISAEDIAQAELAAEGLFRVWTRLLSVPPSIDATPTQTALDIRDAWDPIEDNPTLKCEAPGMIESMVTPSPIALNQDGENIIIRMEEFDQERLVFMGDSTNLNRGAPNPLGYSQGYWDGRVLHVSTTDINWPYFDDKGTPQSESVVIEESFTMSEDEQYMTWQAVIHDAVNLAEPATIIEEYIWVAGEEIKPYNCAI